MNKTNYVSKEDIKLLFHTMFKTSPNTTFEIITLFTEAWDEDVEEIASSNIVPKQEVQGNVIPIFGPRDRN